MNEVRQIFGFFYSLVHLRNHKYVFTNACFFQRIPILECERPSWKLPSTLSLPLPLSFRWSIISRSSSAAVRGCMRPLEPPPDNEQLQQ